MVVTFLMSQKFKQDDSHNDCNGPFLLIITPSQHPRKINTAILLLFSVEEAPAVQATSFPILGSHKFIGLRVRRGNWVLKPQKDSYSQSGGKGLRQESDFRGQTQLNRGGIWWKGKHWSYVRKDWQRADGRTLEPGFMEPSSFSRKTAPEKQCALP